MSGTSPYQVLLYYRYFPIADVEGFVEEHRAFCEELELKGRILIAREGINGTVSGLIEHTRAYRAAFPDMEFKIDPAEGHAFKKLTIKARQEIVALGLEEDIDPNRLSGKRLSPMEFREAMKDPDVVVLDGRNNYESGYGRFRGAVCPDLENFRDFPDWIREHLDDFRGKKVLTYCTGGIRCEKLSGFLLREGVEDVAQLQGGIVEYGRDPEVKGELFEGKCYVFDERIGVDVNLKIPGTVISSCRHCGVTSDRYVNCAYPDCNRRIFVCEECEEREGRFCGADCRLEMEGRKPMDCA